MPNAWSRTCPRPSTHSPTSSIARWSNTRRNATGAAMLPSPSSAPPRPPPRAPSLGGESPQLAYNPAPPAGGPATIRPPPGPREPDRATPTRIEYPARCRGDEQEAPVRAGWSALRGPRADRALDRVRQPVRAREARLDRPRARHRDPARPHQGPRSRARGVREISPTDPVRRG